LNLRSNSGESSRAGAPAPARLRTSTKIYTAGSAGAASIGGGGAASLVASGTPQLPPEHELQPRARPHELQPVGRAPPVSHRASHRAARRAANRPPKIRPRPPQHAAEPSAATSATIAIAMVANLNFKTLLINKLLSKRTTKTTGDHRPVKRLKTPRIDPPRDQKTERALANTVGRLVNPAEKNRIGLLPRGQATDLVKDVAQHRRPRRL
jgi:hypothetical protein